jgi:sulfur-carrier protein adenylyltransferase/sulfurtransferase
VTHYRMRAIEQILDLARWAPSGDNTQPWRFQLVDDNHVVVLGFDTRENCVYDLDGRPSQLSIGALLETIRIAATAQGLSASVVRRPDSSEGRPVFDVTFVPDASVAPSPLIEAIPRRCVQRRALERRAIRQNEKAQLAASLPPGYLPMWIEGAQRLRIARLLFASAKVRLTTREAFEVHRRVIAWHARFSEDRIPDAAIGLDPVMTRVMAWAMQDWRRVWVLNTFFAGTVMPRLQLDFLPALACGAHVILLAPKPPESIDDYVDAGAAVQRLWLTATSLGLQQQPELTPLIFARYVRNGISFSSSRRARDRAATIARTLGQVIGEDRLLRAVWLGRIGHGRAASARSVRLPLDRLITGS